MSVLGFEDLESLIKALVITGAVGILTLLTILRFYCVLTCGKFMSDKNMRGKTIIITGANGGIGRETARDLARRGGRIIMACRNLDSANAVKEEIVAETKNEDIIVKKLDLSSAKSIREFAEDINRTETKIDVLLHNAGIALAFKSQVNDDGIELTMATNHYGPMLLTFLLIDLLKRSKPSRIVIVASELYKLASVNLSKMNPVSTVPSSYLYYVSKYANIYFTKELARRLEGSGVTANCLHPGMIDTGIWRNVPFPLNYPMKLITRGFFKTPEQGAQTSIYLAVSEELNGVSGKYYMDCKEAELNRAASDMEKAKQVWDESLKVMKIADPKI